jgi:predicted dithiol-disulfide oxidoreductase (DUF899 family)
MDTHKIVSQNEWLAARKALLAREKALTEARDALNAERRALPWVKVDKNYVFEGPRGRETLADLFDGRSQLVIYHFMFGPDWPQGCPSCSFLADHIDGANQHLKHHDVTLLAVSRAPWPKIEAFRKRMGWRFKWVSSSPGDFNTDHHVSFTEADKAKGKVTYNFETIDYMFNELPGASVFYKDGSGAIFHTYSSYARGLDLMLGAYNWLDITPKGRNEKHGMEWVRHHDRYDDAPGKGASCCVEELDPISAFRQQLQAAG